MKQGLDHVHSGNPRREVQRREGSCEKELSGCLSRARGCGLMPPARVHAVELSPRLARGARRRRAACRAGVAALLVAFLQILSWELSVSNGAAHLTDGCKLGAAADTNTGAQLALALDEPLRRGGIVPAAQWFTKICIPPRRRNTRCSVDSFCRRVCAGPAGLHRSDIDQTVENL